jgi:hypothetical protein
MWILVLTILGLSVQSGQSVTAISGFTSEAACMAAADAWLKQTHAVEGNLSSKRALCVKT